MGGLLPSLSIGRDVQSPYFLLDGMQEPDNFIVHVWGFSQS